jgi:hypothetical protein
VRCGKGRDLRQVCDAEDLPIARDLPHSLTHRAGGLAAYIRVHLIKNKHRYFINFREDRFQGQHHSRKLPG